MPTLRFDHYEVLTRDDGTLIELGRGAMGITYKAIDTNLRIPVALKIINATHLNSEVSRQRFIREARSAARLRNPHVAAVYHLGTEGENYYYAMEYIDGETVEALVKRQGPLSPMLALQIADQVAHALAAAAPHGLVHRDIKPANLMLLREGADVIVKVIDFGLAKSSLPGEGEDSATLSLGGFVGTPHFASPEQLTEGQVDVRSDIYGLGVTLWFMLSARTPFSGAMAQVMSQHLSCVPPFENLSAPPSVIGLLRRMLEKLAVNRPQTPNDLRRDIEACLARLGSEPATVAATGPGQGDDELYGTISAATGTSSGAADDEMYATISASAAARSTPPPADLDMATIVADVPPKRKFPIKFFGGLTTIGLIAATVYFLSRQPVEKIGNTSLPTPVPELPNTPDTPEKKPELPKPPTRKELLNAAVTSAKSYEEKKDWPECLTAWLKVAHDFPESDAGRTNLEAVIGGMRIRPNGMSADEFTILQDSIVAAAQLDVLAAMMALGEQWRKSRPLDSFAWYCAAAAKNDPEGMTQAGLMLSNGAAGERDLDKALYYFEKAADQHHPPGLTALGDCYLNGKGVNKDEKHGAELLKEAVEGGDKRAMDLLGTCYSRGLGVEKNPEEAAHLYERSAKLGYFAALGNLGVLYINGTGVKKDDQKAVELFRTGSDAGDAYCTFQLARCFEGAIGMSTNLAEARKLYARSAKAGYPLAVAWCQKNGVRLDTAEPDR
jgi:serine/threonine protein kinase/TPR repeat protein